MPLPPKAAWMFEDHPDGTLARDGQVLHTATARLYGAIRQEFRRSVRRLKGNR